MSVVTLSSGHVLRFVMRIYESDSDFSVGLVVIERLKIKKLQGAR